MTRFPPPALRIQATVRSLKETVNLPGSLLKYDVIKIPYRLNNREDQLLLIFTRNPELGKCKTRLAAVIGDEAALEIYKFLLRHTVSVTRGLRFDKRVCYSESIQQDDYWDPHVYQKVLQEGSDLGERMLGAFKQGFADGYDKIIIIGSDMYDLQAADLEEAFRRLDDADYVLGPARDGGYYLLGMRAADPRLFINKDWGAPTVLEATLKDLENKNPALLPVKNDIDVYEDIRDVPVFKQFIKPMRND